MGLDGSLLGKMERKCVLFGIKYTFEHLDNQRIDCSRDTDHAPIFSFILVHNSRELMIF